MKKLFILLSLVIGLTLVSETNAQTKIVFGKGASSKTMTITVPANSEKSFSVQVSAEQVINIEVSGDIGVSKTNSFPVISINLTNGEEGIDRTQDGEGYLSILTGTSGSYVFSVSNSSKRARTFTMKVAVTNDKADFEGGEPVDQ
jgi:hypothetical protein